MIRPKRGIQFFATEQNGGIMLTDCEVDTVACYYLDGKEVPGGAVCSAFSGEIAINGSVITLVSTYGIDNTAESPSYDYGVEIESATMDNSVLGKQIIYAISKQPRKAYALNFNGLTNISVTVDGEAVTSPYTLTKSCTIVISHNANSGFLPDVDSTTPYYYVNDTGVSTAIPAAMSINNDDIIVLRGDIYNSIGAPSTSINFAMTEMGGGADMSNLIVNGTTIQTVIVNDTEVNTVKVGDTTVFQKSESVNLANTVWLFNDTITAPSWSSKEVNFTSYGKHYTKMDNLSLVLQYWSSASSANAYGWTSGGWTNNAYKTIKITSAGDAELKEWLEANGGISKEDYNP